MGDDPNLTKGLRNGAEPLRLSAHAIANAEAKRAKAGALAVDPEPQAAWLAEQVRHTYLLSYRREMGE